MIKYSCKTLTAGRVHLLEEALFSFLNLDRNDEVELIIVNDYPYQELKFDHPRVKIFNFKELFPSIGEKDIFTHDQCQGEIIIVFDDDDIALPHHINNIDKYLEDNDILHWKNGGFYNENVPNIPILQFTQLGNSGIVYPKKSYIEIGKSPIMNGGYDRVMVDKLHNLRKKIAIANPENKDISWIYRWGISPVNEVGCYHLSGQGDDVPDKKDVRIRNFEYLETLRKKGRLPTGTITLNPKWRKNYSKLVKDYAHASRNK